MKILLPCPACQHPLSPPNKASRSAQLRCPQCGHTLTAQSILIDVSQLAGSWEVVEDFGSDNIFASFHPAESSFDARPMSIGDDEMREAAVVVPQSNEWETQPSSVALEEPIETDAEYQIASEFPSTGHYELSEERRDDVAELEAEAMKDEMISVSDEPWFSLVTHHEASDLETQNSDVIEVPQTSEPEFLELSDPNLQETDEFGSPVEDEIQLVDDMFDPVDEVIMIKADDLKNPVLIEDMDDEDIPIRMMDDSPRLPQQIPTDLLGNSTTVLRSRKKNSSIGTLFSVVGGGVAAFPIAIVLIWYVLGKDPFEMGPLVARFVPWIVPEGFRGSMTSGFEERPEMPPW